MLKHGESTTIVCCLSQLQTQNKDFCDKNQKSSSETVIIAPNVIELTFAVYSLTVIFLTKLRLSLFSEPQSQSQWSNTKQADLQPADLQPANLQITPARWLELCFQFAGHISKVV